MKTNKHGIPDEELNKVIASHIKAIGKLYVSDPMTDPLKASIQMSKMPMGSYIKAVTYDQLLRESGSGKRLDRMKQNESKMSAEFMRSAWIVETWLSFNMNSGDEITEEQLEGVGLAYFTDETAVAIIEDAFPDLGEYTKKQFEDFRKKYGLVQVPLEYRRAGVLIGDVLKIIRIGRKPV